MSTTVKMNKQGVRDLNYYGPKDRTAQATQPATVVESAAPAGPTLVPDAPDPVVAPETPTP